MEAVIKSRNLKLSSREVEIIQQAIGDPVASIRGIIKNNLYEFERYFWSEYSRDEFKPNWHIEDVICPELEKVARRVADNKPKEYDLIFNVPPGTTKTATVSIFFPIWCWVNWFWMRFITSSHSSPLSLESAEYSRDVIRSEKFKQIFPEIAVKQNKDTKSNFRVVKNVGGVWISGGGRVSTSVTAKIMGFHSHIRIPDDLIDPEGAISEAEIRKANSHLDVLSTRKVDKEVSVMIMIAQRLTPNDPTGYLRKKKKEKIRLISLPGEIRTQLKGSTFKKFLHPPELSKYYIDDLLDVNRMSWKALKEMQEDLGQFGYAAQVGQYPLLAGAGMFEVDLLTIIQRIPHVTLIGQTVRYWDKAGTAGGGAYTAGVKMCRLLNGKYLILDIKRGQWGTSKREDIIKATTEADGEQVGVYVEQEPGSGGKESADATIKNLAGYLVGADSPTGNKVFRADPYSVQVNAGNVQMLQADWNKAYIDEMRDFPASTYKDQADASSGAFSKLVALKKVWVSTR